MRIPIFRTMKNPYFHPHLSTDLATKNYPKAVPRLPSPSMIPVTVDVAYLLDFKAVFSPRSAEHVTHRR